MTERSLEDLAARIRTIRPGSRRRLIAIAGPPASGKSTLADRLVGYLGSSAALVPMDGFHLDNRLLDRRGLRARKGAPDTFDAEGFVHLIQRLRHEANVVLPIFDRTRDIAIAGAAEVTETTQTVVVEGNYLLLDRPVWRSLHDVWDLSVFLNTDRATLQSRLVQRWDDHGLDPAKARHWIATNDMPNIETVLTESVTADVTF